MNFIKHILTCKIKYIIYFQEKYHSINIITIIYQLNIIRYNFLFFLYFFNLVMCIQFVVKVLQSYYFCPFFYFFIFIGFGGHSIGVTPVLVSITEVKSFCVLFVYYGFSSMGISFCCQPFIIFILLYLSFLFLFMLIDYYCIIYS